MNPTTKSQHQSLPASRALWIALVAALSIGSSLMMACAAPLVAVAALAAISTNQREGLAMVMLAWLSNQIIGYGFLNYPMDFNSFAWGAALGLATFAGFFAARYALTLSASPMVSAAVAFLAAFVAYEAAIYAAGAVLGGAEAAFTLSALTYIFQVNVIAFAAIALIHRAALALALIEPEHPAMRLPVA
ncbi:MAG: hypothetical protein ABL893_00970 [Hyphomicrobium sp.]|nr:hypothetical protein [Hyphomicrobium sp.]